MSRDSSLMASLAIVGVLVTALVTATAAITGDVKVYIALASTVLLVPAVAWLVYVLLLQKPDAPAERPRVVLTYRDSGHESNRQTEIHSRRFLAENRGGADAFNVLVEELNFDVERPETSRLIVPLPLSHLMSGSPQTLLCNVRYRNSNMDDLHVSLAEALDLAMHELCGLFKGPCEPQDLVVRYTDHDGRPYSETFRVTYTWALRRFGDAELTAPPARSQSALSSLFARFRG